MHVSIIIAYNIFTYLYMSLQLGRPSRTRQDSEDTEQVRDSESGPKKIGISFLGLSLWDLLVTTKNGDLSAIQIVVRLSIVMVIKCSIIEMVISHGLTDRHGGVV